MLPPHLDLLHRQVQEGVLVADADQALGALAAHAGAQTAVELDYGQLVERGTDVSRETPGFDLVVGLNLWPRGGGAHKSIWNQ